jgi:hypothetical protein
MTLADAIAHFVATGNGFYRVTNNGFERRFSCTATGRVFTKNAVEGYSVGEFIFNTEDISATNYVLVNPSEVNNE